MPHRSRGVFLVAAVVCVLLFAAAAWGGTINVGTTANAANWKITGAGASGATAFQLGNGYIGLTSNGGRTGTFVTGGSLSDFNGFWYAELTFFLPANATNVSLDFSGLSADDRTVLQLNGTNIGNETIYNLTGNSLMMFSPSTGDEAFTFTDTTSGTITSGFVLGGDNTLGLVVNNTGWWTLGRPTRTFYDDWDGTAVFVDAAVNYSQQQPVPEPATLLLLGGGLAAIRLRWRRGNRA